MTAPAHRRLCAGAGAARGSASALRPGARSTRATGAAICVVATHPRSVVQAATAARRPLFCADARAGLWSEFLQPRAGVTSRQLTAPSHTAMPALAFHADLTSKHGSQVPCALTASTAKHPRTVSQHAAAPRVPAQAHSARALHERAATLVANGPNFAALRCMTANESSPSAAARMGSKPCHKVRPCDMPQQLVCMQRSIDARQIAIFAGVVSRAWTRQAHVLEGCNTLWRLAGNELLEKSKL